MKQILVLTDSEGSKSLSIKNCFSNHFKLPTYHVEVKTVSVTKKPETPFTLEGLYKAAENRVQTILDETQLNGNYFIYVAVIQKGFYFMHGQWQLGGVIAIKKLNGELVIASMSTVQLLPSISEALSTDISFKDAAIRKEYPGWEKEKTDLYNLFTGEPENQIFMEALRRNMKRFSLF